MLGAHSHLSGSSPCSSNPFSTLRQNPCSNGLVPHRPGSNLQHGSCSSGPGMMLSGARGCSMTHGRTLGHHGISGLSNLGGPQYGSMGQQSLGMQLPVGLGAALNSAPFNPQNPGMGMGIGMGMSIFSNPWGFYSSLGQQRLAAAVNNSSQRTSEKKDIFVRGSCYAVRRSYLAENKKFEENLVQYMDKKNATDVPDFMVDMLVKCINDDSYTCTNILDEVTLYILANSVGASSVKETAFAHIKKFDLATTRVFPEDLIMVTVTVLCAEKADNELKDWLKNMLASDPEVAGFIDCCMRSPAMCMERPEAMVAYERLVNPSSFPSLISWRSP